MMQPGARGGYGPPGGMGGPPRGYRPAPAAATRESCDSSRLLDALIHLICRAFSSVVLCFILSLSLFFEMMILAVVSKFLCASEGGWPVRPYFRGSAYGGAWCTVLNS